METVINQAMRHPRMRSGTAWVIITDGETDNWPAKLPRNTVVILVNDKLQTGQEPPASIIDDDYDEYYGYYAEFYGSGGAEMVDPTIEYVIPEHIRRAAVCISKKDFVAGGVIAQPGRAVA
jgi:hypothetical protein